MHENSLQIKINIYENLIDCNFKNIKPVSSNKYKFKP